MNDDHLFAKFVAESGDALLRYGFVLSGNPTPLGDRLAVQDPGEGLAMLLWFARNEKGDTLFCTAGQSRSGGGAYGCNEPDEESMPTVVGSTNLIAEKVLYYGLTKSEVTAVTTLVVGGGKIPSRVEHPAGTPWAIWTATVPRTTRIDAFEFTDAQSQVTERKKEYGHLSEEFTAEPVGPAATLPHDLVATLVKTPDETLIWRLDGDVIGQHLVRAKDLLTNMGGDRYPVSMQDRGAHWFGITDSRTARVDMIAPDGTASTAATRRNPWNIDVRLFSGVHQRTKDIYAEGFELVGYDEAGTVLWRESQPAVTPLWR
ncbi:hypothetical protein [Acrocarpospora sp. B8E8]|uniref:hypothetical protein n=1 Tax=Acrocarpospora sp. B8E8 TaxID=3153572 RepID=UPI00325CAAC0